MLLPLSADTQKVIIAPLNWGLGHATRCIPIIRQLVSEGKDVVIACDGEALELLQEEFPQLTTEKLPAYNVTYNGNSLTQIVLSNVPNIFNGIIREKSAAKRLSHKHQPDLIISDSRFGFRSGKVKSVIITHQLTLMSKSTFLKFFLNLVNRFFLNAFDACWVPDDENHTWSGALSQSKKIKNQFFLGPLSRLQKELDLTGQPQYDLAIILSGPEPARSKLEKILIGKYCNNDSSFHSPPHKDNSPHKTPTENSHNPPSICLVRGTRLQQKLNLPENWTIIERADSEQINKLLLSSDKIISRSGYTSIMDYAALGVSAYLIPTPGQSEQEYLAEWLHGKEGMQKYDLELSGT